MHSESGLLDFWKADSFGIWVDGMARRIFYSRRSRRPIFIGLGLACLCMTVFYAGIQTGRTHPDLFALENRATPDVIVAER